jgi:DNA-binding transcriptional MerR regulator
MKKPLVGTKDIAEEYDKPISAVQRWARMGIIPVVKVGHRTRYYDPEAVRKALLRKTVKELS